MTKTLTSKHLEIRRNGLINRIAILMQKNIKQTQCSKYKNCNYFIEQINAVNMTVPEANGYITLVCEKYPNACELNINLKDN